MFAEIDKIKSRISARMRGLEISDSSSMGLSSADTKEQFSERADSISSCSADYSSRLADQLPQGGGGTSVQVQLHEFSGKSRDHAHDDWLESPDAFPAMASLNHYQHATHESSAASPEFVPLESCLTPRRGYASSAQFSAEYQFKTPRNERYESPFKLKDGEAHDSGQQGWSYTKAAILQGRMKERVNASAVVQALAEKTLSVQGKIEALREYLYPFMRDSTTWRGSLLLVMQNRKSVAAPCATSSPHYRSPSSSIRVTVPSSYLCRQEAQRGGDVYRRDDGRHPHRHCEQHDSHSGHAVTASPCHPALSPGFFSIEPQQCCRQFAAAISARACGCRRCQWVRVLSGRVASSSQSNGKAG
jgi:hypothetical protein